MFLNIHRIINLEFDVNAWRFSQVDEWGWLLLHGFVSSMVTGICALCATILEKKRIYQTQMIKAFKN